jgi:hypothetical protein
MIAAVLLAASVLATSGVTAGIQADLVCLPVTAQPGVTYALDVAATAGTLSVAPAHGTLERQLHQASSSWVSFRQSSPVLLGPDKIPGWSYTVRLAVPQGAETGAYWSDITVTTGSSGPGDVSTGAAATVALVFTVGPSPVPPPPCGDLDVAQATGKFPPWPTKAFATTSWKQVFARQRSARPAPEDTCPTATAGPAARPAPSYCPGVGPDPQHALASPAASPAAYSTPPEVPKNWPGWLIAGGIGLFLLYRLLKLLRVIR